jgi:peptide/nickel transport system permease protein
VWNARLVTEHMSFLSDFVNSISVPPGDLVYHLVTLFEIQLILGIALEHWNRHRRDPAALRMLVTGLDFAFARGLLMLIAVLDCVGVLSAPAVLPPLERFLEFVTLLLMVGAFLPIMERYSRLGVASLLLALIVVAGVYVASAILWLQAEPQGLVYNDYWQQTVWEVLTIAVLALALVAGVVWRDGDWGLLAGSFALWLVGHVLQLVVPVAHSHTAGWVRLANLAVLPLLAVLVYRRALQRTLRPFVHPGTIAHVENATDVQLWLRRGVAAARADDLMEARRCFQTARDADPDNVTALLWLARLAHTPLESLALFSRVLELDPENQDAHAGIRRTRRCISDEKPVPVASPGQTREAARMDAVQLIVRPRMKPISTHGFVRVLLHLGGRLLPTPFLLVALVFTVALAMDLGQAGGLGALHTSVSSASTFTADYLAGLAGGDMGAVTPPYPAAPAASVVAELVRALPRSLGLLAVSLMLAILLGLPLGIVAGLRRNSRFSGLIVFLSVLGISTPSYFAAMLLIWFGVWLYRSTGMDFIPLHGFGWDEHLILPALVLAARPAAYVMRLGYNALVEVLDADFVRTARAKGLGPRIVLFRHVLRSAGVPLLTAVAVSLRSSLVILPIVEYIFNWSGVGQELLTAVQAQDTSAVVSMVLPLALVFVLVNLLLEVLCLIVDPRLRVRETGVA